MGARAGGPAVATLEQIVGDAVADGALVATGGGELRRKPMAAVRALAESGRRDLRVATMLGSADVEALLGAGVVAEVHSAGVALLGLAPRWREARQTGAPRVVEWSEGTFVAALQAAALGLDSQPWPTGLDTDLPAINPSLVEAADPHTGARVLAVRALVPDVALLHVDGVDEQGNAHVEGDLVLDGLLARAARRVVVTYEREVDADPALAAISHLWIDDAVPSPGGAVADGVPPALRRRRGRAGGAVIADLLTGTLAEELVAQPQLRVFVPTTPATAVAARAARHLGAQRLALSDGLTAMGGGPPDWATDVFTLLRRGLLGVAVAPIQLDAAGRTNLSGIGEPGRPKVALIGPRGLPDNNDTPCPLWYLLAAHSGRTLVERVDVVCGPAPTAATGPRTLLSSAGCFDLADGRWRARWLTPGGADQVAEVPAFPIEIPDGIEVRETAAEATLAALAAVDPDGARRAEFGE